MTTKPSRKVRLKITTSRRPTASPRSRYGPSTSYSRISAISCRIISWARSWSSCDSEVPLRRGDIVPTNSTTPCLARHYRDHQHIAVHRLAHHGDDQGDILFDHTAGCSAHKEIPAEAGSSRRLSWPSWRRVLWQSLKNFDEAGSRSWKSPPSWRRSRRACSLPRSSTITNLS